MVDADITQGNVRILLTMVNPAKETQSILGVLPFEEGENPYPDHVISAAALPSIRSRNKKFWNSQAEQLYKEIYGGKMVLVTRIEKYDDVTKPRKIEFAAYRYEYAPLAEAFNEVFGGLEHAAMRGIPYFFFLSFLDEVEGIDSHDILDVDEQFRQLTEDQRHHLCLRAQHLWTMTHGLALYGDDREENFKMFRGLVLDMEGQYKAENLYEEARELHLGGASKMCFQMDEKLSSDDVQRCVYGAGNFLEASKQYKHAACVYHAAAKAIIDGDRASESKLLTEALAAAGTASVRSMDFQQAEKFYLQSTDYEHKKAKKKWERSKYIALRGLVELYAQWAATTQYTFPIERVFGLISLMLAANVDCPKKLEMRAMLLGVPHTKYLKSKYLSRKVAQLHLSKAVSTPNDIKSFHTALTECIDPLTRRNMPWLSQNLGPNSAAEATRRQFKKAHKEGARKFVTSNASPMHEGTCDNCKKMVNQQSLKWCPCRVVRYCGRECQIEHWKTEHKDICPHKKANDAKKQAKK